MPPRSANRKVSARAKKSTPKSKQPDVESSTLADENTRESEFEHKDPEFNPSKVQEVEEAAQLGFEDKEIKQVIEIMKGKSDGIEGLSCGGDKVLERCENVAEEKGGVDVELNEGVFRDGGSQSGVVAVAEMNFTEEETAAEQINDIEARGVGDSDKILVVNEGSNWEGEAEESGDDEDNEEDSDDNNDNEDPSVFIHNSQADRKKEKTFEIFIGRLDKGAVEDDLIEVFGKFGEIKDVRIVRYPTTQKSKGYAFIRYAMVEQAQNALSESKDGIQVRGKHVKVSASQDNDTIYMGNICKIWTKERVLETLKHYGIEHIEAIHLPDDPNSEGRTKGFALLEFSTHSGAVTAFQRLRKRDAVFGRDRSAKVSFTQTPVHPTEEVVSQIKRVYVDCLPKAWNEEKVKEICKQYGEIVKVDLFRNLGTKRKDFGFITFTSRESALACVEGLTNAQIAEGEVMVKASIAKPQSKDQLQRQGFHGGFKVTKESKVSPSKKKSEKAKQAGSSKLGQAKSKGAKRKGKVVAQEKGKALSELGRTNHKRKNLSSTSEGYGKEGIEHGDSRRPSKKPRGNKQEKQTDNFRNPKRDRHSRKGAESADRSRKGRPDYAADSATYRNPYALGHAASTTYNHGRAHSEISASKRLYTDMEPHAGYLEPIAGKQGRHHSGYLEPAVRTQVQPHTRYVEPAVRTQVQPHAGYVELAPGTPGQSYAGYLEPGVEMQGRTHARYLEPTLWTQGLSHGRYLEPTAGAQSHPHLGYLEPAVRHNPYDPQLRRAGGHAGQDSSGSAYGGVGSALPASHVPNYTSYAGYEVGSSVGGYSQSSGVYLPRRTYY